LFLRNDKGHCHFDRFQFPFALSFVISTNGKNPNHRPLSFRSTGEILTNVYKISQSLRSFEMTRGIVISTVSNFLSPFLLSFRPAGEILTISRGRIPSAPTRFLELTNFEIEGTLVEAAEGRPPETRHSMLILR